MTGEKISTLSLQYPDVPARYSALFEDFFEFDRVIFHADHNKQQTSES